MADISLESGQGGHRDEIEFTFDNGGEGQTGGDDFSFDGVEEQADGDDFDFDIGAGTAAVHQQTPGQDLSAVGDHQGTADPDDSMAAVHHEDGTGLDEIDYEDQYKDASALDQGQGGGMDRPQEATKEVYGGGPEDGDEIGYDEDDVDVIYKTSDRAGSAIQDVAQSEREAVDATSQGSAGPQLDEFDAEGDSLDAGLQDVSELPDAPVVEGKSVDGLNLGPRPAERLIFLVATGRDRYLGDEFCPLFRTSETDSLGSFYLEDVEVLNLPLSAFLDSIRSNISPWVDNDDEISIRVDQLGLEFGETTTEAMLSQVTFNQLVALHDKLLKNEDPEASQGLSLVLTTRPNCTLRLRKLVEGANSGRGLSTFLTRPAPHDSSAASDYNESDIEAVSQDISQSEVYDEEAEHEDSNAQCEETTLDDDDEEEEEEEQEASDDADEDQDDLIGYEETARYEGHAVDVVEEAAEEEDLIGYPTKAGVASEMAERHDLEDDHTDPNNEEDEGIEYAAGLDESVDDLISYDDGEDDGGHQGDNGGNGAVGYDENGAEDLDRSADIGHLGENGPEHDDPNNTIAYLVPQDGPDTFDATYSEDYAQNETQAPDDDEYLDLGEDIAQDASSGASEDADKVTFQSAQISSYQSSATTTLDGDEIDYEESGLVVTAPEPGEVADEGSLDHSVNNHGEALGVDEIDWDDEDKISAPNATTSTPTSITGKRSREVTEIDDLLDDDSHACQTPPA